MPTVATAEIIEAACAIVSISADTSLEQSPLIPKYFAGERDYRHDTAFIGGVSPRPVLSLKSSRASSPNAEIWNCAPSLRVTSTQ